MGRNQQENSCRRHQQKRRLDKITNKTQRMTIRARGATKQATEQNIIYEPEALTSATETVQYDD